MNVAADLLIVVSNDSDLALQIGLPKAQMPVRVINAGTSDAALAFCKQPTDYFGRRGCTRSRRNR